MSMRVKGDGKPRCRDEWHAGFGREGAGYVPPQGRMTRCALTSRILSSTISATQTQWDYLSVLVDAIRRYGAPEAIVTDGGGQFYSTVAFELYEMLGIRKERIDPGEPWQNYAETLFSIQKRLADHAFSNARTWPEMQQAHQTWWQHYNVEHHYAHRERQDGRHSPEAVLRGVLGRTYPDEVLSRVLYATQFTRSLDSHG